MLHQIVVSYPYAWMPKTATAIVAQNGCKAVTMLESDVKHMIEVGMAVEGAKVVVDTCCKFAQTYDGYREAMYPYLADELKSKDPEVRERAEARHAQFCKDYEQLFEEACAPLKESVSEIIEKGGELMSEVVEYGEKLVGNMPWDGSPPAGPPPMRRDKNVLDAKSKSIEKAAKSITKPAHEAAAEAAAEEER